MNDPFLGLLGIARRAGKLTMGHDMAIESIMKGKSTLVVVSSTSSERLAEEFRRAASAAPNTPPVETVPYTMDTLHQAVGYKAGVFSVNDAGFAAKLLLLLKEQGGETTEKN